MTNQELRQLQLTACDVRKCVLTATHSAKSGHPGGSLSAADLFTYLYFHELRIDPKNPKWADRDRFVLSKGHTAPGLYGALALRGYFPVEDLTTLAKGAKYLGKDVNVYCLLGDGEIAEGQVWEASLFAAHYKLDNFCAIVDVNGLQIDGRTADVMNTAPLSDKFAAFGYDVTEIDGHDFTQLEAAFAKFHANAGTGKPTMILMHTTKGKGVSYMEDQAGWHGKAPNDDEYAQGIQELDALRAELEAK